MASVAFACLRVVSVLAAPVATFFDSASYFDLRFWHPYRLWTVPLIYSVGLSDDQLVAVQLAVGVVAWVSAAVLTARVFRSSAAQTVAVAGLLVLGLTTEVVNFDAVILSESIALSLSVLLVALGLNVVCRPSRRVMWAMAAVTFFWAFSRHLNVYLLWMATIVAALATLSRARRRHFVVLVCVLGAVALTGTIVSSSNTTVQHANITAIIIRRIAPDADLRLWWRREGMPPLPPGVPPSPLPNAKNPSDQAIFDQADLLYEDKRFPSWLGDHANSAYLRFLATHPRYILTTPFTDRAVIDGFLRGAIYTHTMQVVPNFVEDVVWPTTRWGALLVVLALTIVCFVVFASSRRLHGDRVLSSRSTAPLRYAGAVLVISGVAAFLTTHVAGVEFGRVLLVPAVAARSAVVIVIAAVVDEALSRRRESTS